MRESQLKSAAAKILGAVSLAYPVLLGLALLAEEWLGTDPTLKSALYWLANPPALGISLLSLLALSKALDQRIPWSSLPLVRLLARAPVALWVGSYVLAMSLVTLRKHELLATFGCDLGIFDNVLWNTLHGNFLYSSILERHFFGEHVAPILLLVLPFYALWPDPRMLLVLQSVALGLAAVPLYWLAREKLGPLLAGILALSYLLYRPLHGVNLFDFHEIALAVPLLLLAFHALERGRERSFLLFLVLAAMCKEEVSLIVAAFGVYRWLVRKERGRGLLLAACGAALFLFEVGWVIPAYRGGPFPYLDRYSYLGDSLGAAIQTLMAHPGLALQAALTREKAVYLLQLFGPLAFTSLLGWPQLLLALPTLARNLLSDHAPQYSLDYHFPAPMIPFIFVAAIYGCERLLRAVPALLARVFRQETVTLSLGTGSVALWRREFALQGIPLKAFLGLALLAASWGMCIRPLNAFRLLGRDGGGRTLRQLGEEIPGSASLAAHNSLAAHFSDRPRITVAPLVNDAEFVLLRYKATGSEYPLDPETDRQQLLRLILDQGYGVFRVQDRFVLLRKGYRHSEAEFQRLIEEIFLSFHPAECPAEVGRVLADPRAAEGRARFSGGSGPRPGLLSRGPGRLFPPGDYTVHFSLRLGSESAAQRVAVIEVAPVLGSVTGQWSLARRVLSGASFGNARGYRQFTLSFVNPRYQALDFRVQVSGRVPLWVDQIRVIPSFPLSQLVRRLAHY